MKTAPSLPAPLRMPLLVLRSFATSLLLLGLLPGRAEDIPESELTVVSSTVHNGYQREKLPDGSLKPVKYAFGEGTFDSGNVADPSLDRLKFGQLATLLSAPLAKLGFRPSQNAKAIDQLLVVHWGRTVGWDNKGYGDAYSTLNQAYDAMKGAFPTIIPEMKPDLGAPGAIISNAKPNAGAAGTAGPSSTPRSIPGALSKMEIMFLMINMQDEARARANTRNSRLLGYHDTLKHTPSFWGNMVTHSRELLVGELEDDRYYVIVVAYDFRSAMKNRQRKVLWITRFSLVAHGNDFDRSIERMVQAASSYFGRSTDGLHREGQRDARAVPGKLEVIDYQEPTK